MYSGHVKHHEISWLRREENGRNGDETLVEVVAAFEQRVHSQDLIRVSELISRRAARQDIEDTVQKMVGDLGFMLLAKLDAGPLVSLLGRTKKIAVYLLGNPVFANRMFEQDPAVAAYAPLRAVIYADNAGATHFTYDQPSSLLGQFAHDDIRAVAQILDDRLNNLANSLAS